MNWGENGNEVREQWKRGGGSSPAPVVPRRRGKPTQHRMARQRAACDGQRHGLFGPWRRRVGATAARPGKGRPRVPGPRVAALAPDPRRPRPFPAAGYWQVSAHIYLGCTFGGSSMDLGWRLRWPPRAVQAMMTRTRLCRPGTPERWRTTTVRIESAGQPRSTVTAEPLTDDSLAARLLPATIALRNHIGRGSDCWSRPISPTPGPSTSDPRASRERARPENRDKTDT